MNDILRPIQYKTKSDLATDRFYEPQRMGFGENSLPTSGDIWGAAWRVYNPIGAYMANGPRPEFGRDPEYNAFEDDAVKGLVESDVDFSVFKDALHESNSADETRWLIDKISREQQDRRHLGQGGLEGMAASLVSGAANPLYWVPWLRAVRTVGGVKTVAKLVGEAVVGEGITEAFMHGQEESRTLNESAMNVMTAGLATGILGSAFVMLRGEQREILNDLMSVEFGEVAKRTEDEILTAMDIANRQNIPLDQALDAVGAQVAGPRGGEFDRIAGGPVAIPAKLASRMTPIGRLLNSPSPRTRWVATNLVETPFTLRQNLEGIATPQAVETMVKIRRGAFAQATTKDKEMFRALRKRGSRMSDIEFRKEVVRAMRNADTHHIPEVEEAAKYWRKTVFDPIKKAAQQTKAKEGEFMLPGDEVLSKSYVTRIWNRRKVIERRDVLESILKNYALKQNKGIDEIEAMEIAADAVNSILKRTDEVTLGVDARDIVAQAASAKTRKLKIRDEDVEDFIYNDVEFIGRRYVDQMGAELELAARFEGDFDLADQINKIREDYDKLARNADEKTRSALADQEKRDIADIEAMRDRIRGVYGLPANPHSWSARLNRSLRDFNYLIMLGGMTISAMPDMARLVLANGFKTYAKPIQYLAAGKAMRQASLEELKRFGVATEMAVANRVSNLAELDDVVARDTWFERGLEKMSEGFSKVTLMAQWNSVMEYIAGTSTIDRIIHSVVKYGDNLADHPHTMAKLAKAGIDQDMAKRIAKEFRKHGESYRGFNVANMNRWDDREAANAIEAAVVKEVNSIIVKPGVGDKPLWMSTQFGKLIGQFQSFGWGATNRMVMSGLSKPDLAYANSLLIGIALGAVVEASKLGPDKWEGKDTGYWMKAGIDRSGAMGIVNDYGRKIEGTIGIGPTSFLSSQPLTRHAQMRNIGDFLGPWMGTTANATIAIGGIFDENEGFRESEVRAARRLIPYQNLFYTKGLLDAVESRVAEAVGQ